MLPPTRFSNTNALSDTEGDAGIRSTDTDATLARLSAVHKGYLTDPFASLLAPRGAQRTVTSSGSRPPLINIGTHVRTWAVDELVYGFVEKAREKGVKAQIVSVGAGSDTRFWRLQVGDQVNTNVFRC
jgi:[phosphatase 2A protein]-leucine-carboxy methyltransferase